MSEVKVMTTVVNSVDFQKNFQIEQTRSMRRIQQQMDYEPDYLAYISIRYSARRMIPYGRWTTTDGREVIFNREYQPMYSRKDGVSTFCDRNEFVENIAKVEYFYGDHNSPVDYLTRKLKPRSLQKTETLACKKSLEICLNILIQYEPTNDAASGTRTSWRAFADYLR